MFFDDTSGNGQTQANLACLAPRRVALGQALKDPKQQKRPQPLTLDGSRPALPHRRSRGPSHRRHAADVTISADPKKAGQTQDERTFHPPRRVGTLGRREPNQATRA